MHALKPLLVTVAIAAAGCGNGRDPAVDAGADAQPARIVVPATRADLQVAFALDAEGAGTAFVDEVSLSNTIGTATIGGDRLDAVTYRCSPWPENGVDVYHTLVVASDRLYIVWLYCASDQIDMIWHEGTDGTSLRGEGASGSCIHFVRPTYEPVEFPAVDMPYPALESGYTFSGADLRYDGVGPGTVTLDGVDMVLLPFESVDCSTNCGGGAWRELHALFYDPVEQRGCFGIFYMQEPERVTLSYSICLPDLEVQFWSRSFAATWEAL